MSEQEKQALMAELTRLKAENQDLKTQVKTPFTVTLDNGDVVQGGLMVSKKGAVSVYGLGRFPITLYVSQWATIFAAMGFIKNFIQQNAQVIAARQPSDIEEGAA